MKLGSYALPKEDPKDRLITKNQQPLLYQEIQLQIAF